MSDTALRALLATSLLLSASALSAAVPLATDSVDNVVSLNADYADRLGATASDSRFVSSGGFAAGEGIGLGGGLDPDTNEYLGAIGATANAQGGPGFAKADAQTQFDFAFGNYAGAAAFSSWRAETLATTNGTITLGARYDRTLLLEDPLGFADRSAAVLAAAIANSYDVETFSPEAFILESQARLTFLVEELDSGNVFQLDVFDRLRRQFNIGKSGFEPGDYFVWGPSDDFAQTEIFLTGIGSVYEDNALSQQLALGLSGLGYFRSDLLPLDVSIVPGAYRITMDLSCSSYISVSGGLGGLGSSSLLKSGCDAGRSAYFAGVLGSDDGTGNPIAGLSLISGSGTDLTRPSPFFPGGGGVVPEPETWAMLIAGFGLVGAAARRRRARHSLAG